MKVTQMFIIRKFKISLFLFALSASAWSTEWDEQTPDQRYDYALKQRKLRTEESLKTAAEIFLQLAHEGTEYVHLKAAHNYGCFLYDQKKYDDAAEYFYKAGLERSIDNYIKMRKNNETYVVWLVIGSTRDTEIKYGIIIDPIYDVENVDTSHTNTFKGFATTMDAQDCVDPKALHIKGNVSDFDFSKFKIKAVFFENFVTTDERIQNKELTDIRDNILGLYGNNYMGKCIENQGLRTNAFS